MIAILNYNAGNTQSVKNAVEKLGYNCLVTDDEVQLRSAEKVIFPGVGEAASAMAILYESGLDVVVRSLTQPVLGICLGLQLMCSHTEEGDTAGLGIFDAKVRRFPPDGIVPHTGWNTLQWDDNDLFRNIGRDENFYFVHSYYAAISAHTMAQCDYILTFSAALKKNNFYAVQFHPEKSGAAGEKLLKNFLEL